MIAADGRTASDFAGRAALVTGAGGMIGSAVARRLAAGGAAVCLAGLDVAAADVEALIDGGARAVRVETDVSDKAQVERAVRTTLEAFGRLDILVTVAGVTSLGSFEAISTDEWDRVHAVNLKGVFLCNQAVLATMKAAGYGRIVNIGSVLAKNGGNPRPWLDPDEQSRAGNAAYGAAKAGVHALTLYLAKEAAAFGVTVNAVAPGPIASAMTRTFPSALIRQIPAGRLGAAEEVAAAVAFLAAQESAFITGEILDVNGGLWVD